MATNRKVEILKHVADLNTNARGWTKELNIVSWNGNDPKYDIREWSPDHEGLGKGTTLTAKELQVIVDELKDKDLTIDIEEK